MTGTYPAPAQTAGKATAALVVAIVGFFVCAPIGGIVALILAGQARRDIESSEGRLTGQGMVTAAKIIGIIDIATVLVAILAIVAITFLGQSTSDKLSNLGENIENRIVVPRHASY